MGDLVHRGPYSLRVLERVRELVDSGCDQVVLGNHDRALLAVWQGLRALRPLDTYGQVLEDRNADDWMHWLRRRPIVERGVVAHDSSGVTMSGGTESDGLTAGDSSALTLTGGIVAGDL